MSDGEWLAQHFEESRGRLPAVAYRILTAGMLSPRTPEYDNFG